MERLEEVKTLLAELKALEGVLLSTIAEGSYRLQGLTGDGLARKMARFVLFDLTGHQEKPDLYEFYGKDPELYLTFRAFEKEMEEILEELLAGGNTLSKKEIFKAYMSHPKAKEIYKVRDEIRRNFIFLYYSFASRRDEERIKELAEETLDKACDMLGEKMRQISVPIEDLFNLFGLSVMNNLGKPVELFLKDVPYAYERKLLIELPYAEFVANVKKGEYDPDWFYVFGVQTDEMAEKHVEFFKKVLKENGYPEEEIRETVEVFENYRWYSISDYGHAVFFSEGVRYKKENEDRAVEVLDRLSPQIKVEHLLMARAYENLARNTEKSEYLKKAKEHYELGGNFVKALECEVLYR